MFIINCCNYCKPFILTINFNLSGIYHESIKKLISQIIEWGVREAAYDMNSYADQQGYFAPGPKMILIL